MFKWVKNELNVLLNLALPIFLNFFFQYTLLLMSLIFLGHLPKEQQQEGLTAGAGLGVSFLNVTGVFVGDGLATTADTLCSQAFGYKNYKRVGIILQRGILILGLFLFPIWALWLNTESLLLLLHQPPCAARFSDFYVKLFTIPLPFIFLQGLLQHYLNSQSIVWQFAMIGFISNCISVILHVVLIYGAGLGFKGAVIALVVSNIVPPLLVIAYVWWRKLHEQTWGGWSFESLQEWGMFLKLGIPGMCMMLLEYSSCEIIIIISGAFGETMQTANVTFYQIYLLCFSPYLGLSIATSVRVGNELGAGNPQGAKRTTFLAVGFGLCLSVTICAILLSTKDVIGLAFISENDEAVKLVSQLCYIGGVCIFLDQTQFIIGGALNGSGRQYIGAIVNVVAYYCIGIPLGVLLAFKLNMKLIGLWIGMLTGTIVQCAAFVIVLLCTDWKKESEKAMKKAQGATSQDNERIKLENRVIISKRGENGSILDLDTSPKYSGDIRKEIYYHEDKVRLLSKDSDSSVRSPANNGRSLRRLKKVLLHGSFYVVGVAVLMAGGIASHFKPYVDPEEYENCSSSYSYNATSAL